MIIDVPAGGAQHPNNASGDKKTDRKKRKHSSEDKTGKNKVKHSSNDESGEEMGLTDIAPEGSSAISAVPQVLSS